MKMSSDIHENYELSMKLVLVSFTDKCHKCQRYEEAEGFEDEGVWMYCGSSKWETDDFGNMVDFVEEKHCDFKPLEITHEPA